MEVERALCSHYIANTHILNTWLKLLIVPPFVLLRHTHSSTSICLHKDTPQLCISSVYKMTRTVLRCFWIRTILPTFWNVPSTCFLTTDEASTFECVAIRPTSLGYIYIYFFFLLLRSCKGLVEVFLQFYTYIYSQV